MPETERQQTERILGELLARAKVADEAEVSRKALLTGLFSAQDWPQPPRVPFPRPERKKDRRSDLVLAALGVTLGLICALFPWSIFFNEVHFATHGLRLGGKGDRTGRIVTSDQSLGAGVPLDDGEIPTIGLDVFPTGTVPDRPADRDEAPGLDRQPFPAGPVSFHLVHVANGRAMIADDAGLWIVQRGSRLPDNSEVASIERRDGKWVLVTSTDEVIELAK